MKSAHALIRELHLLAGLVLALAVLVYAVSGAAISYAQWLPGSDPEVTTSRVPLPPAAQVSDQALRSFVESELGVSGRAAGPQRQEDGRVRLQYSRPGTVVVATAAPDRSEVVVETTRHGWIRTLRMLHVVTGYGGGAAYLGWALLLDLVALAVIGFALSGIYLWYQRTRHRRLGWLLLGVSWSYTIGVILYLWLA